MFLGINNHKVLDWEELSKNRTFMFVGASDWWEYENKVKSRVIGTNVKIQVISDEAKEKKSDGEIINNTGEQITVHLPGVQRSQFDKYKSMENEVSITERYVHFSDFNFSFSITLSDGSSLKIGK